MIDLDPRYDAARQLAAEQYALRAQRAQMAQQVRSNEATPQLNNQQQPPVSEILGQVRLDRTVAEISRDGLIGSRRLGRNFEAMLRERPRLGGSAEEQAGVGDARQPQPQPQSQPLLPSLLVTASQPSDLPLFKPGSAPPPRPAEDPNSPDLNLSEENRLRALQQGLPASATARAATEMFR